MFHAALEVNAPISRNDKKAGYFITGLLHFSVRGLISNWFGLMK
jgi:hypothetical protein